MSILILSLLCHRLPCDRLTSLQEHLTILQQLSVSFPEKFAELNALSSTDIEVDFFANVAHLQVHRRIRSLRRLVKVSVSSLIQSHENPRCKRVSYTLCLWLGAQLCHAKALRNANLRYLFIVRGHIGLAQFLQIYEGFRSILRCQASDLQMQ